jgi:hypothetical protein
VYYRKLNICQKLTLILSYENIFECTIILVCCVLLRQAFDYNKIFSYHAIIIEILVTTVYVNVCLTGLCHMSMCVLVVLNTCG